MLIVKRIATPVIALLLVAALGQQLPAAEPAAPPIAGEAVALFDGKTLGGWKSTPFGGEGEVKVEDGRLILEMGSYLTGVTWTKAFPKIDYEISLEAMRMAGNDFFCGLTFPVGDNPCSFIVGGWGGGTVGLSSLNDADASENDTTTFHSFDDDRWYKIRVRVTKERIQAWIDAEKVADVKHADYRVGIRSEVELSKPLGICTFDTTAALRNIKLQVLPPSTEK